MANETVKDIKVLWLFKAAVSTFLDMCYATDDSLGEIVMMFEWRRYRERGGAETCEFMA